MGERKDGDETENKNGPGWYTVVVSERMLRVRAKWGALNGFGAPEDSRDAVVHWVCVNEPWGGEQKSAKGYNIVYNDITIVQSAGHAGRRQYSCPERNRAAAAAADSEEPRRSCYSTFS